MGVRCLGRAARDSAGDAAADGLMVVRRPAESARMSSAGGRHR